MFITTAATDRQTWNTWAEYAGDQSHLGDLPDGWEAALAPNGEVYFVNHHSKKTTWIDPRTKDLRYPTVLECQPGDLPYGWEEITLTPGSASTKLTVFANHNKGKLTLHDPTRTNARKMQYMDKRNLALVDDTNAKTRLKHQIKTYWMDQVRDIEEEYRRGMRTAAEELEEGEIVVASPTSSSRSVSPGGRSLSPVHSLPQKQDARKLRERNGSSHQGDNERNRARSVELNVFEQRRASRAIGVQTVATGLQRDSHYVAGRVSPQRQPIIQQPPARQAQVSPATSPSRGRHASKGSRSRPLSPQRFPAPVRQHSDDKIDRVKTAGA